MRSATGWILALALLALAGCAEIGPPPGGPPDLVPPYVLAARPDSLATRVDPAAEIALTFSEKVERRTLREWIGVNPYRPIKSFHWDGPTIFFELAGGLPADTTVQVYIGSGVTDRAGLPMYPLFSRLFTTGDSIAPGVIEGKLRASRLATATAAPGSAPGHVPLSALG
ncbi:MAG TPA: Ig-like domain-containing protein, partial [Candidatus Eisenbacteria bacterium]